MNKKRIRGTLVALLTFLIIVFLFSLFADLMGETSPTSPIRIIAWVCGSLVAFKIFEKLTESKKEV